MIAPGHSFVWSSPAAPAILLKSLFLKDQALRFRLSADPYLYAWSLRFLLECTADKARRNTLLKHRLALHSQSVLRNVVAEEGIEYDRTPAGDRKSTRLNSSHNYADRLPTSSRKK